MNNGLSNQYVQNLLSFLSLPSFIGCFPIDLVPKITKTPSSLVINLDESYKPGSHFVAVYITSKEIIYFDSFGLKPNVSIKKIFSNIKIPYKWNKDKIQSDLSQFCGYYCIGFLISQYLNIELENFTGLFFTCKLIECETRLLQNDQLITYFIKSYIKSM